MRHIYTTGECILDIAFRGDELMFAGPGGSKLNTAVSLGRLGLPVSMISECSDDPVGELILSFLRRNGISTEFIAPFHGLVRLAFAFLDQQNNASYTFYPGKSREVICHKDPDFTGEDIFLFGSFYSLKPDNRQRIHQLILAAQRAGSLLMYDPNFRKPHVKDLEMVRPFILENIRSADIVRGSDEDFRNIFELNDPESIHKRVSSAGGKILVLTQGQRDVMLFTEKLRKSYTVHPVPTISTIGAGDNFNAGIIYELVKKGIRPADLNLMDEKTWDCILNTAISFAAHVCGEAANYISQPFANNLISPMIMTMNDNE